MTKTAKIDARCEPELVDKIDVWRERQPVPPSRSAAVVHMLRTYLASESVERDEYSQPESARYDAPEHAAVGMEC